MPRNLRLAFLLLSAPLWTGCAAPVQTVLAPRLQVPDSLLTCPAQPEPPVDTAPDRDVANWIVDMAGAGQACRDNLASVKGIVGP